MFFSDVCLEKRRDFDLQLDYTRRAGGPFRGLRVESLNLKGWLNLTNSSELV